MLRISLKKSLHKMLIIYPLLNLLFCWLNKGDGMNGFSCLYCLIMVFGVWMIKKRIARGVCFVVAVGALDIIVTFAREERMSDISYVFLFLVCMLILLTYSDDIIKIDEIENIISTNRKLVHIVNICFIFGLLLYVQIHGLRAGWNTWVLQGPYNYPHTLAYLILFLLLQELYLFIKGKDKVAALILIALAIALFMTAVRTAILALVVVVFYVMYQFLDSKQFKRFLLICAALLILAILLYKRGTFESLIDKTQRAISNGSISNGRAKIYLSSLGTINKHEILACTVGVGLSQLLNHNLHMLGAAIHAHNDFIDVLVCYGGLSLFAYVYTFMLFIKKSKFWNGCLLGILIFFNGLFPYVDCLPIIIYSRLLFESGKGRTAYEKNSVRM